MKKSIFFSLIVSACLLLTSACSESGQSATTTATPDASATLMATPMETESGAQQTPSSDSAVVAESSNIISDKEKQAILDDLLDQMDTSLDDLDGMEKLDDSEMNMDDIE